MCGLFGFSYYGKGEVPKGTQSLLTELAKASTVRGTDATGIAYNLNQKLEIDKAAVDAYQFKYEFPKSRVVMGHTRKTTRGAQSKNYNNHPFRGKCGSRFFALAHNGMLSNDFHLRKTLDLPETPIETDSYVAVQLIEKEPVLSVTAIKNMAELVQGIFTFSILDDDDNLYFVKNDNPLVIAHIPSFNLYVYASTFSILMSALVTVGFTEQMLIRALSENSGDVKVIFPKGGTITVLYASGTLMEFPFTVSEDLTWGRWKNAYGFGKEDYWSRDYIDDLWDRSYLESTSAGISSKTGAISLGLPNKIVGRKRK